MKKIYSLLMVIAIAFTTNAQLRLIENFSGYTNGALNNKGGWVQNDNGTDVAVATLTPLTYSGYTSGTQYITVIDDDGRDPHKPFSQRIQTNASKTVFMSFVVRVTDVNSTTNVYSLALRDSNSTTGNIPFRFFVQEESGPSNDIQFGIGVGATASFTTTAGSWAKGTTYLIVLRYDIVNGGADRAYLWVNPSLATEPTIGAVNTASFALSTSGEVGYGSEWNVLQVFQQGNDAPEGAYDAFRIAEGVSPTAAWTNLAPVGAPLPVKLTSFNAAEEGLSTKLAWNVVEESGITSYVIEKSTDGRNFTAIGSVKAASLKSYSYTDAQVASENNYYRLKMVEIDGTFKYSYIISVKSKLSMNISLSPNPVRNMLMVQHPKAGEGAHIQIVSAAGQTLKDIRLSANAVISNVDLSGYTSGLYHVVFRNGSEVFSKTVLKQ